MSCIYHSSTSKLQPALPETSIYAGYFTNGDGYYFHPETVLKVQKLVDDAVIPTKSRDGDAGFDLHCHSVLNQESRKGETYTVDNGFAPPSSTVYTITETHDFLLRPNEICVIDTGIAVSCPDTHCFFIKPRSGLAAEYGLNVLGGVIDSNYRGSVKVILINHGDERFKFDKGDRIAQLVCIPIHRQSEFWVCDLSPTVRGADGFGSSGRNSSRLDSQPMPDVDSSIEAVTRPNHPTC